MAAAQAQPQVRRDVKAIPAARKAEKRQVKMKFGIQGPSGSGKTEGALALATNLFPNSKILLVDTENESASLYADRYDFDTIPLDPPYESSRYEYCIDYAVENKYDVLILDSVTHQWDGEGGILRRKEELDRRPNSNSFTNWATFTPEHTHFIETIKQAPIHIIATMRSKQEYALQQNDKGKQKPVKLGMSPIQRDGFDYEFTVVFDVQMDHRAVAIKNRTGLFGDKAVDLADPKTAGKIREWLDAGKASDAPTAAANIPPKPQPQPVQAVSAQKVEGFTLDGETLSCHVYGTQKRKAKNGTEFVAVKHNGKVNSLDIAFCFHESMFDALLTKATGKRCKFFIGLGTYVALEDVLEIDGQRYKDGQPVPAEQENIHGLNIADEEVPFPGDDPDSDIPF